MTVLEGKQGSKHSTPVSALTHVPIFQLGHPCPCQSRSRFFLCVRTCTLVLYTSVTWMISITSYFSRFYDSIADLSLDKERRTKGRQNGGNHSLQFSQAAATLTLFAGRDCPCAPTGLLSVSIEYRSEVHSGVPLPSLGLIVLAFRVVCGFSF